MLSNQHIFKNFAQTSGVRVKTIMVSVAISESMTKRKRESLNFHNFQSAGGVCLGKMNSKGLY